MNYGAQFNRNQVYMRRQEYAPYLQDNWKVTRRLTLNLGLRWEYRTPVHERTGAMMGFDLAKKAYVIGTDIDRFTALGNTLPSIVAGVKSYGGSIITAHDAGLPQDLVYKNWKNFGPRFGFAYRVRDGGKAFVIRGGYRISYYTEPISNWFNSESAAQLVSANFVNSVIQHGGVAGRPAQLRTTQRAAICRRGQHRRAASSISTTRARCREASARISSILICATPGFRTGTSRSRRKWRTTPSSAQLISETIPSNILQTRDYNDSTPAYIWYAVQKTPVPAGTFANVATRPYDQQVWGTVNQYVTSGMANFNGAQLEVERRFGKGWHSRPSGSWPIR